MTPREIKYEFGKFFSRVAFVERSFLRYSTRGRALATVPLGPILYGLFLSRFMYGVRDDRSGKPYDLPIAGRG